MKSRIRSLIVTLLLNFVLQNVRAQVPVYNSNPSATPVIYLDFDGETVDGTSWNSTGPIYCGGSGLSASQIVEIFNRVAEDYRPFTVNITTDSSKYFSAPANRRMRVIITVTSDWYGSAGGVSFVNSFSWGDNTPCFVFSALLNFDTKNIAEAVSHEAGHTLGLRHQSSYDANCVKTSEYNSGQGTGEQGWAPIMGVGYARNLTTWYNGQSTLGCNIYQDDLGVITGAANGIAFRSDYEPTSFANAVLETFTNGQFITSNIIVKNTYENVYRFVIPSLKLLHLSAIPFNVGAGDAGANLDLKLTLYDSLQDLLNTYVSSSTLSVDIDTTLAAGSYFFKVEGVGNTFAPDYAIIGSYSVQGQLVETPLPLHSIGLSGTIVGDRHILNWSIQSDQRVTRQVLESSVDGKTFTELSQPPPDARSYAYTPEKRGSIIYRLHAFFDSGSDQYSNNVLIKQPVGDLKPKVINTLVTNGMIMITSPGSFDYFLFDANGKMQSKGKLSQGLSTINALQLSSGAYFIRFTANSQQWTEKLVKQ